MFKTIQEARRFVEENGYEVVDLKFSDLWGRWRHVTIPKSQFDEHLLRDGVGFDGSSVGLKSVSSGDMVILPDLTTAFRDPFCEHNTLSFICSAFEADTKKPFAYDPRNMVIRAEDFLRSQGIADESIWGPEYEFYVFSHFEVENTINASSYRIDCIEADWNAPLGPHGHYIAPHGGYYALRPRDQFHDMRTEMCLELEAMGVPVKYHHHEVGGPAQLEIETPLFGILEAGDSCQKVKYVTKNVAVRHGQTVTYMPKPLFGEAGSGMHFHQMLRKGGKNLFYSKDGYGSMSQLALWYIGGILKHGGALLALTNPSTNSYRRLVPGYEAPINAFFSLGNRSAAIRIPKYADQEDTARFEFRPPDATCNVYMALAAQLMAGIDGIINKIDPTAEGFGPYDVNLFSWTDEERKKIKALPTSLEQACDSLEQDNEFLLAGGVFDKIQLEDWVKALRQEIKDLNLRPHPFEMAMYYDI